ncbi:MAG: hypothetical protein OXU20_22010 [Myxococcales bacterium]|nr:hypothetical protein [Myxococcales bacterium]
MDLRCITGILLVLLTLTSPGAALAEDDDDDEVDSAESSSEDPWERPPEEEEEAPGKGAAGAGTPFGDGRPLQVGLALGYGFETEKNRYGAHPYGFAGGLRAGYTLDIGVFVGLSTTYFLGSSNDGATAAVVSRVIENSVSAWLINLEVGYDLWFGPVIFRPGAEIGMALTFVGWDQLTGASSTRAGLVLVPGASLIYPFDELYLGGDMRLIMPVGDSAQGSVTAMVVGGMRFKTKLF